MNIRKRKLDASMRSAVLYMQQAAMNRGIKTVELPLFIYAIVKTCKPMLERYVDQQKLTDFTVFLSKLLPDSGQSLQLGELTYAKDISGYVAAVETAAIGGPGGILLDAAEKSDVIGRGFTSAGITRANLEMVAKAELRVAPSRASSPKDSEKQTQPATNDKGRPLPSDVLTGFCSDLTEKARAGQIGEVFCRDGLVDRMIVSLMRKVKSNPLLVGEPGVGKTAIVEAFAARVARGDVPARLAGCRVFSLDLGAVVGGTTLRGEFEERMKHLLLELENSPRVILFIDEVHMLVGAGDHAGSMDAANIFKPYLARGTIKVIGATTHADFNKHIAKDGALARRFQRIYVNELSTRDTLSVLEGLSMSFEKYHGVAIEKEALERIIFLTRRHIGDRHFPDKAIDCLDEACARASVGPDQGVVTPAQIEEAVSNLAGVPISVVRRKDKEVVEALGAKLKSCLFGNDAAIDRVCETLAVACSALNMPDRPLCSMVLFGLAGVGKKSCIKIVSEELYGEGSLVEIDGAEYAEPYSCSKILGSPPGYIGYREEGQLVRSIKRRPHSIVLVHNLPLMHPDVREQFIKIMKTGQLVDSEGNSVDFRSAIIAFSVDRGSSSPLGFNRSAERDLLETDLDVGGSAGIFKHADARVAFCEVDKDSIAKAIRAEIQAVQKIFTEQERELVVDEATIIRLCKSHELESPAVARRGARRELELMARKGNAGKDAAVPGESQQTKITLLA